MQIVLPSWRSVSTGGAALLDLFEPCLLLPRMRFDLIGAMHGGVLVAPEPGGYPLMLFEHLVQSAEEEVYPEPASIMEVIHYAGSDGRSGIVAFPYSIILGRHRNLPVITPTDRPLYLGDNVLLVRRSWDKAESHFLLTKVLRAAWFELLENPHSRQAAVDAFTADQNYLRAVRVTAGLYSLPFD